ncbi:MAG: SpoIIE family protein phosphatase [Planctomycetaceae bacterium]|nr:SpoIIE family protein phosphatase [Planctomycetaceae bacterium]
MKRRIPSFRPLSASQVSLSPKGDGVNQGPPSDSSEQDIAECIRAFSSATNWGVELDAPNPGRLVDNLMTSSAETIDTDVLCNDLPSVSMERATVLLGSIEKLIHRIERTETALRDREAELTSIVAVSNHAAPSRELAARLESVLESTSRTLGSVACALYLLDEDTTELKLRACYGLPKSRFLRPARDLRSSLADLEALTGNAVLLSDIHAAPDWQSPEPYRSALVVPIGTTTMPHGTVWFCLGGWSHQQALIGGAFHHWSLTQQGKLSIVVGAANANHATGSMVATSALSLLQLFETDSNLHLRNALQTINDQHWNRGHEAWQLHLSALQLQPETGTGVACSTGHMHCLVMGKRGIRHIGSALPSLGSDPDQQIAMGRFVLEPGEMLVAFTSRMLGDDFDISRMLKFLRDWREEPAQDLACSIAEQLPVLDELTMDPSDRALVILKSLR